MIGVEVFEIGFADLCKMWQQLSHMSNLSGGDKIKVKALLNC